VLNTAEGSKAKTRPQVTFWLDALAMKGPNLGVCHAEVPAKSMLVISAGSKYDVFDDGLERERGATQRGGRGTPIAS